MMWHKKFQKILAILSIFLFWELAALIARQHFLPGALASVKALFELSFKGVLIPHFIASLYRITFGTLIGLIIALPFGIALGQNSKLDDTLGTVLSVLYPVPKVVFLPIIVTCMGIGDAPKVFLISLVLFFQMAVVIRDASRGISKEMSSSMKMLGANKFQYLYHLVFLSCLPDIMTALRSTIGISTAMLFITETFASSRGLGYYITKCMDSRDYEYMYAGVLALIILGLILYGLISMIEHRVCRWKRLESAQGEEGEK